MRKVFLAALFVFAFTFTAQAQDCSLLDFGEESLTLFVVGEPAQYDIQVTGGTAPYHFEITDGALPAGLHLTGSGKIRGIPREAETYPTVFIRVTDANGCQLTRAYTVQVAPAP